MPSLSTAGWDNLLIRSADGSTAASSAASAKTRMTVAERGRSKSSVPYFFSPALYAINEPALPPHSPPVPDEDFASPYLLNHKRRDSVLPRSSSYSAAAIDQQQKQIESAATELQSCSASAAEQEEVKGNVTYDLALEDDVELFNPPEARTDEVASAKEITEEESSFERDVQSTWMQSSFTTNTTFYDAHDGFADSPRQPSTPVNISNELDNLRSNLLEEIVRRKRAEEAVCHMQNLWKSASQCLSEVGISLPDVHEDMNTQNDLDLSSLCQEITVARYVSEAVGRALARAEVETAAKTALISKNLEVHRLKDRLQYYEAVNHTMSQRNQEAIEHARQKRLRSRNRRKWIWGCITLSSIIGASIFAASFLNQSHMIQTSNQPADDSSNSVELE